MTKNGSDQVTEMDDVMVLQDPLTILAKDRNALELGIYGFFSYRSCCFARDRRRPSVIERGRYAEDMYAPAFIPGGMRTESSLQFTFSRGSRFIPPGLSDMHWSTTPVRAVKKISAQAE